MGAKTKIIIRVVLDTNILESSLLFKGELTLFHTYWKEKRILPLLSRDTFQELQQVLTYPKFNLSDDEITFLIKEEILPYFEVVDIEHNIQGVCSDPDDDKFISCALSGDSAYIITGDKALPAVSPYKKIKIITPAEYLKMQK